MTSVDLLTDITETTALLGLCTQLPWFELVPAHRTLVLVAHVLRQAATTERVAARCPSRFFEIAQTDRTSLLWPSLLTLLVLQQQR